MFNHKTLCKEKALYVSDETRCNCIYTLIFYLRLERPDVDLNEATFSIYSSEFTNYKMYHFERYHLSIYVTT